MNTKAGTSYNPSTESELFDENVWISFSSSMVMTLSSSSSSSFIALLFSSLHYPSTSITYNTVVFSYEEMFRYGAEWVRELIASLHLAVD